MGKRNNPFQNKFFARSFRHISSWRKEVGVLMWQKVPRDIYRIDQYFKKRTLLRRIGYVLLALLILLSVFFGLINPRIQDASYELAANARALLDDPVESYGEKLQLDEENGVYEYNKGYAPFVGSSVGQSGTPKFIATLPLDPQKGTSITDPVNEVSITFTPKFGLGMPRKDVNQVVYPLKGMDAHKVYTLKGSAIKEDIILHTHQGDTMTFDYDVGLPEGTQMRLENDGSIGVYGADPTLLGKVSTSSEKDAELLKNARENANKEQLLFRIPAPFILEGKRELSPAQARFELRGNELKIIASELQTATYPISIDPSVYIETASKLMRGNNETNIDFNVDNELIQKGSTTGARFDEWQNTMPLDEERWAAGTAVAGGYIYVIGGKGTTGLSASSYTNPGSFDFEVPTGITEVTISTWGGGGGGGGGGSASAGGNGGGGGFARSTVSVTPSETLNVRVGGGGDGGIARTYSGDGGGGGGYSGVYRSSTPLIIGAGGAGGGGGDNSSGTAGGNGGAGGGTNGIGGGNSSSAGGGGGGTPSSGGSAGTGGLNDGSAGSSETGGDGADGRTGQGDDGSTGNGGVTSGGDGGLADIGLGVAGGGGGGSGRYGGGGGSASASGDAGGGGGGGGSSYTTGSSTTNTAGSGTTPGNNGDALQDGSGIGGSGGGSGSTGSDGESGLVVIQYSSGVSTGASESNVYWAKFNPVTGIVESPNPGEGACSGWCTDPAYNLPAPRSALSVVAYNGFLYAFGGQDGSDTRTDTVYIAKLGANGEPSLWHPTDTDPDNWEHWYVDTSLSSERTFAAAKAYNNRIYLLGGQTDAASGGVSTVEFADINPNGTLSSWTSAGMTSLPNARHNHSVEVYNDRMYLLGGNSSGTLQDSVYYTRLNSNGTMNDWVETNGFGTSRMAWGGNFSTIWGGYIYIAGGCSVTNGSGYCTSTRDDIQLASINADGSLTDWNTILNVTDTRQGYGFVSWRNTLYGVSGCMVQSTVDGSCTTAASSMIYGDINQDGDASTVSITEASGSGNCTGGDPYDCDLPPPGDAVGQIGHMLSVSVVLNGYLYVIGGCVDYTCDGSTPGASDVSGNIAYVSIGPDGTLREPATCSGSSYGSWCVDSTNRINGTTGVAAAGVAVFESRIYVVGGLDGGGNTNTIFRNTVNDDGSLSGAWASQSLTGTGAANVSYTFAYARANPDSAGSNPGNLFIFGGCTDSTQAGCTTYSTGIYKCNIQTGGAIASCSTAGQLQMDSDPSTGGSQGLGIHSGTVYANYIYLIGGVSDTEVDKDTVLYAQFDDNNDVVAVSGSGWIESPNTLSIGRRRGYAFGYNGYLYAVGGYEDGGGGTIIPDIEFAKVNVSDGSIGTFNKSVVTINQRWGLSMVVSNSYAYVIGGCNVGASPGGCSSFEPSLQTFQIYNNNSGATADYTESTGDFATANSRIGASATVLGGYIYAAGGTTPGSAATDNVQYAQLSPDGTIGSWSDSTGSLPEGRAWGQLESAGGSLYYVGGRDDSCSGNTTGNSRFERWNDIGGGTAVSDLYNEPSFPDNPDSTQTLSGSDLAGPTNIADNFGGRLSAIICPPTTGDYTFWIASDDSSELRLSTDLNPDNVSVIASVTGWTNPNEWTKYGSQESSPVTLTAGVPYYIEANYKEGSVGDNISIGWTRPGNVQDRPISNTYYSSPEEIDSLGDPQSSVYYATPSSGDISSWSAATNGLPGARSQLGAAQWNNRLYITGGIDNTGNASDSVYVSPQLNSGGDIASTWTTEANTFDVARSGLTTIAYANNLYIIGGDDGTNYFSDVQYTQINADGTLDPWSFTTNLTQAVSGADGFAANGFMYIVGGRSSANVCTNNTYVSPISANTTIATGNEPTGIGEWYQTNVEYEGERYGSAVTYDEGKLYMLGGGCIQQSVTYGTYTFDADNDGDEGAWTFVSDNGTDGLNSSGTNRAWSHDTNDTPSVDVGPTSGQGGNPDGYVYTEASSPAAGGDTFHMTFNKTLNAETHNWDIEFYWNQRGNSNLATVQIQTNENGGGWTTQATYGSGGPDVATGGTQQWNQESFDLSSVVSDSSTELRLLVTLGSTGDIWHNDFGIDSITIDGEVSSSGTTILSSNQHYTATLQSQPQVARYSRLIDTDTNVFPTKWLMNGVDNSIGARWQTIYRSSTASNNSWGVATDFGDVTLGNPEDFVPLDGTGTDTDFARYFYFTITIDSSQTYGYPDDVTRGPTLNDLSLFFTSDPSKRLRHGKTFTGGEQQPLDTPF
ncbi:MAG: PA14 domain-containing protein [Candidatus Saccharibacteria bacterium]|nr:PA14 domain-containing protein [Candidatus Saccharibacteria bacterium]